MSKETQLLKGKILRLLGVGFTAYGFAWFLIGVFHTSAMVSDQMDALTVGLLSMILGELVDMQKNHE